MLNQPLESKNETLQYFSMISQKLQLAILLFLKFTQTLASSKKQQQLKPAQCLNRLICRIIMPTADKGSIALYD